MLPGSRIAPHLLGGHLAIAAVQQLYISQTKTQVSQNTQVNPNTLVSPNTRVIPNYETEQNLVLQLKIQNYENVSIS